MTNSLNGHAIHPFADVEKPIDVHGDVHFKSHLVVNNTLEATDEVDPLRSAHQGEQNITHQLKSN